MKLFKKRLEVYELNPLSYELRLTAEIWTNKCIMYYIMRYFSLYQLCALRRINKTACEVCDIFLVQKCDKLTKLSSYNTLLNINTEEKYQCRDLPLVEISKYHTPSGPSYSLLQSSLNDKLSSELKPLQKHFCALWCLPNKTFFYGTNFCIKSVNKDESYYVLFRIISIVLGSHVFAALYFQDRKIILFSYR
ncbi:uncharacterized protein LOC128883991 [Hylaeus volcanicus]|uniref:uncharacterized protein LOC128883991 n=1 Tax=Hylaeus volcanicus TaxID=313075 RepID=UPI0023B77A80|nr:uncharacterized protein LOC128883991 [Hylaeus volcanicus]